MSKQVRSLALTLVIAVAGACAPSGKDAGEAVVAIVTTTIPADGQCTRITLTRLSDFQVTEYVGPLASATLRANSGEHRVNAVAYPQPCSVQPAEAPWVADAQQVTFARGQNPLSLTFRPNARVVVDASFDDGLPPAIVEVGGSRVRVGRNAEDVAAGSYLLDGYEVKTFALPPSAPSETVLFSTQGNLVGTARGLARMPDGRFAVQLNDPWGVFMYSSSGAFEGALPIAYAIGGPRADFTDSFDAIDATHLIRVASSNAIVECPVDINGCAAWLEILEFRNDGGGDYLAVVQQLFFPDGGVGLHWMYALGVTAQPGRYFVSVLETSWTSYLFALNTDGTLAAGPVFVAGPVEGLFVDASNRLITMDYAGNLRTFSTTDLVEDVSAALDYRIEPNLWGVQHAAWRSATGSFLAYNGERLASVLPDMTGGATLSVDLSGFTLVGGLDYLPGSDALAVIDRFPPLDASSGQNIPQVVMFDLASGVSTGSVLLAPGVAGRLRPRSLAYVAATHQFVTNYRRQANLADAAVDPVVFLHEADGTFASSFSLAPYGFTLVSAVNAGSTPGTLLVRAVDTAGVSRLVVTDLAGTPLRSYTLELAPTLGDLAVITTGAFAGQVGLFDREPATFVRTIIP